MNSEMESFDFVSHTTSIFFFFFCKFQELVMTSLDLLLVGRLLVALSSCANAVLNGTSVFEEG